MPKLPEADDYVAALSRTLLRLERLRQVVEKELEEEIPDREHTISVRDQVDVDIRLLETLRMGLLYGMTRCAPEMLQ